MVMRSYRTICNFGIKCLRRYNKIQDNDYVKTAGRLDRQLRLKFRDPNINDTTEYRITTEAEAELGGPMCP